jgi:tricarballylate dehydrogenase
MADGDRVIVVGAGNAVLCAASAARDAGADELVLERADKARRGGNTALLAGAIRVVYNGAEDLRRMMPDLTDDEVAIADFGHYTEQQYTEDLARVTEYRADPDLAETLVRNSYDTLQWMCEKGVRFLPIYGQQAFKVDGRFRFWGGLTIAASEGAQGIADEVKLQ